MTIVAKENSAGAWAFLIGVIIAVVVGMSTLFIPFSSLKEYSATIYGILVVLGCIIGFSINVSNKDAQTFLMAGVILVIVSRFGMESVTYSLIGIGISDNASSVFASLLSLFVPATIIVALKTLFSVARI